MKKKLLLTVVMVALLVCAFALCVSAAQRSSYQSYEVELVSGERITAYQAESWDPWQGRIWITDNMYAEPPVDTEATYEMIDWADIKVLDFTNAWGHVYNETLGEYELKRGTNGSMHVIRVNGGFTAANAVSLEKIVTGAAKEIIGGAFNGMPALKELVVDSSLLKIGYNAFDHCKQLSTITYKEGVQLSTMGYQSFRDCGFESITLPASLKTLDANAFGDCKKLKSFEWPSYLTAIPNDTFNGCTSLEFEIPSWVTKIGNAAFRECDSLVSVTIPDGVTELGSYAFSKCDNLEEIVISENSQIANNLIGIAEYCPKLTSIRIPHLVKEIGYDNFRGCTLLSEVIWPDNLLKISGGQNFINTSYTKVTIPNSVTFVGEGNFTNVEEFNFGANVTVLKGKNLMSKNLKRVYFSGSITEVSSFMLGYSNSADSSMNITFICTGTRAEAEAIMAIARASVSGTNNGPNASKLYDAVLVSAADYDVTQEPSGFTFVYGYNFCDAFYGGEHAMTGNATMQFKGYFNDVTYEDICTRESCGSSVVDTARTISAMFTWKGYSYSEFADANGAYSVTQCFKVNKSSIAKYIEATGAELAYGVLATGNASGEAFAPQLGSDKVLSNQFKTLVHDYFEIKVSGITEELNNKTIVFCAYVIENGNMLYLDGEAIEANGEISYVGATKKEVTGISYNELKK